jgi:hypothetical protein
MVACFFLGHPVYSIKAIQIYRTVNCFHCMEARHNTCVAEGKTKDRFPLHPNCAKRSVCLCFLRGEVDLNDFDTKENAPLRYDTIHYA